MHVPLDYTKLKAQFQKIMNSFDFDTVQKIMKLMKWTYLNEKTSPSVEQLKACAESLFDSLVKNLQTSLDCNYCSSGGFKVSLYRYEEEYELTLEFVAIEKSSYLD